MVIYLDTSCLLKLFRPEPLSGAVLAAMAVETQVVVSVLVELETLVQLKAAWAGGDFTRPQWRRLEAELARLRNQPPFEFRNLPGTLFQAALRQHRNAGDWHCRSLDRLHLAAMEELNITRLMTHDEGQARVAAAAGFKVVRPGRN
jgi:predicted nucleic acid-binding protein